MRLSPDRVPNRLTAAASAPGDHLALAGRLVLADEQAHLPVGGGQHLRRHPIDRNPADAWADFVGWRVIYEQAAYALAFAVDAAPALWSGPAATAFPLSRRSGPRLAATQLDPVRPSVIMVPSATS